MTTLLSCWDEVKMIGYNTRINNEDGLKNWQPMKEKYKKYILDNNNDIPIKSIIKKITDKYYKIGDDLDEHTKSHFKIKDETVANEIERNHFFIQHFRIPILSNYKLSVLKFLQIAYNAGQYKAMNELEPYSENVNKFYKKYKLGEANRFVSNKYLRKNIKLIN